MLVASPEWILCCWRVEWPGLEESGRSGWDGLGGATLDEDRKLILSRRVYNLQDVREQQDPPHRQCPYHGSR